MAFEKITAEERAGKGNFGMPDTPALTTSEMQEQMDSLANLAIDKFNELIDALNAESAATNIGAEVPTGITAQPNMQSVLNAMVTTLKLCNDDRHAHLNKEALDTISTEALKGYDRLASLFALITVIASSITDNEAAIPTSAAVKSYVDNYDLTQKIRNAALPVGIVVSVVGVNPTVIFGGTWSLIDTDANNVSRYVRTA